MALIESCPPQQGDTIKSPRVMPAPLEIRRDTFPDTTLERLDRESDSLDRTRPKDSYPIRPKKQAGQAAKPRALEERMAGIKNPGSLRLGLFGRILAAGRL